MKTASRSARPMRVHADIRTQGQGRYSHWTRNGLYLSASDNSDPRTNGRKYEVASTNPDSTLGGLEQFAGPPQKRVEVVRASQHEYTIPLGGNLDFENSHTRLNDGFLVAFQPNLSVTIENTGEATILWPKVIANDRANWGTYDDLLAEFTRGATNDQEKALFIWQTARDNRYHCSPLFADDEFHDPVKLFNSYGLNLCDDMGCCGCSLFKHAGLGKPKYTMDPKVRALHGHVQGEAVVDNRYQFLDIDESVFYLDRENETADRRRRMCPRPRPGPARSTLRPGVRRLERQRIQRRPVRRGRRGWFRGPSRTRDAVLAAAARARGVPLGQRGQVGLPEPGVEPPAARLRQLEVHLHPAIDRRALQGRHSRRERHRPCRGPGNGPGRRFGQRGTGVRRGYPVGDLRRHAAG